ncbi:MAG: ribonuclease P protein component [Patescibacteria group bacterium]|nr:ribonuclease P protein component [Patescibacteria group bacterium]
MAFLIVKKSKKDPRNKKFLIIVVGRTVSKKAVLRNKIKRRIRVIAREFLKNPEFVYTIITKPEITRLNFKELKQEIIKAFKF